MALLINLNFWAVTITVYLLLLTKFPGSLTFRFGFLNLIALYILLGWKTTLGALGFVILVWITLNLIIQLKTRQKSICSFLVSFVFFSTLFLSFLLHKLNLGNSEFPIQIKQSAPWLPAEILFPLFATLSFSYIFVRSIDLIHSCIWKNQLLLDPISLIGFLAPFHMLVAGPVNIYDEHIKVNNKTIDPITPTKSLLIVNEVTTGLFYKFVLAEGIRIYFYGLEGNISIDEWFDSIILVIYVFFDFAGYSKIARGIGLLYGIPTPENFNAPFLATTITDFWTRWHMSMGQFVLRNIFTPIQLQLVRRFGIKWAPAASLITMVISFGFVGLWHRLSWTWFFWGIGMGILMAGEKFVKTLLIKKKWNQTINFNRTLDILGMLYVFFTFSLSVYFVSNELF